MVVVYGFDWVFVARFFPLCLCALPVFVRILVWLLSRGLGKLKTLTNAALLNQDEENLTSGLYTLHG